MGVVCSRKGSRYLEYLVEVLHSVTHLEQNLHPIFMTILDEVLQAETDAATKIAEAKAAATSQIADAKTAHTEAIEAEKQRLAQTEATELAEHEQTVQANSQAIIAAAEKEVKEIKATFAANATKLQEKIQAAVA